MFILSRTRAGFNNCNCKLVFNNFNSLLIFRLFSHFISKAKILNKGFLGRFNFQGWLKVIPLLKIKR